MMQSKGKAICLAVMLTLMLPAIAAAQAAVPVWGEWNQDQTVTGCVEIQNGDTLTIAEGVTVSLGVDGKIIVRSGGTLVVNPVASGCPSGIAPVTFTRVGTIGGWQGIVVEDGGTLSMRYADVMWATDTGLTIESGATVGTLDHVNFSNCSGSAGGGILTETTLTITDSSFVQNSAGLYGGGIEATGGTLTLSDVWLEGNTAGFSGGAVDLLTATLVMVRGRVQGNNSATGSGIGLYGSGALISNVFFYNNENGAVISRVGDTGIALYYDTFNANDGACVEGNTDANVVISACIMWDNGGSVALTPALGTTTITACDIQGLATLPSNWLGAGNIDADPLFLAAGDYNLDPSSPAVGSAAGEDMGVTGGASAPGPAVTLIDLGGNPLADPFDVGTALVGTPIVRVVQLTNTGQEAVDVASAVITGAQAGAYSVNLTPGPLAPGECLPVTITFDPAAPGTYDFVDLVITHSDGVIMNGLTGDTQQGTGSDLVLVPDPAILSFGTVLVDTASTPLPLTITNPVTNGGMVEVDLAAGGDADVFSLSETNFMIPAGGVRTIWVMFNPESVRAYESIVTPTVNGVERADMGILLVGSGTELLFSVAPSDYQFPPTQAGLSNETTVTVTNLVGSTSILVTAAQPGSGYSVVPASAPIAAGGTADFTVTFTPETEGFVQADLVFSCTLGDNDQAESVELRGIGIPTGVGIVVAPAALAFADTSVGDTSSAQAFAVTNVLDDFVIVDVTSPATPEFDLISSSSFVLFPSDPLDTRDTRIVYLTMSPSAAAEFSDSVTVTGILDGTAINVGTEVVALQGRGTDSALDVAPDAIDFGDVEVFTTSSTVSVSVVNIGTEPVNIFAGLLNNEDDFEIVSESCSSLSPLQPAGLACFYEVAAKPQAEGTATGELAIYTSDAALPTIIDLAANGTPAAAAVMSVDPTTIDMGDVAVFVNSLTAPGIAKVTITNSGATADLIVNGITFDGYDAAQFTAYPPAALPLTIVPGASADVYVDLLATGIGVRATTMTIASNAGEQDVTITAVSQVGYPNGDGFGWTDNGQSWGTVHARGEPVYITPGVFSSFYFQQITALTAYVIPADNFIWMEGPAFLQYLDNTGTWQTAASQADIESASTGATLSLIPGAAMAAPAPVGEGVYTLHVGFDLVRDNAISEYDVHYVNSSRSVIFGPKPTVAVSSTTLVGDGSATAPSLGAYNALFGSSVTPIDAYVIAQDPTGTQRWLDGTGVWNTGTPARLYTGAVNALASPFAGAAAGTWTGYPITDPTMVGEHTITVIFDRSVDDVLNDMVFTATETIVVNPVP